MVVSNTRRNDPCPCGSGRKYKKCCLGMDMKGPLGTQVAPSSFTTGERASALSKLLSFAYGPELRQDLDMAFRLFWGGRLEDRTYEEFERILDLPQTEVNFNSWYIFDMDVEKGKTIADFFLAQEGHRLSSGEVAYLENAMRTHFSLYEVERVEMDKGLYLKDLWTRESVSVRERAGTQHIVEWDIVATRLMNAGENTWVIDGGIYNYPPRAKRFILKSLGIEHKRFRLRLPNQDDVAFFKRIGILFNHWWLDWVAFQPLPRLVTVEGDDVGLTKLVFDIHDVRKLRGALERQPEFEKNSSGKYSWGEEGSPGRRSLGTLTIRRGRLVVETMSKGRAERGRDLLERIAGEAIGYRASESKDVNEALKSRATPRRPRPPEIPRELQARMLAQFYDQHYRQWLDEEIPALDHKTPRHAVTLKTYRPRVIDLLKEMENMEARKARHGEEAYNFGWLWKELGLEREGKT